MKKLLAYGFIIFVLALIGGAAYLSLFAGPQLKPLIERKASEALGTPVTTRSVAVKFRPNLTVVIEDLQFSIKSVSEVSMNVEQSQAGIDLLELFKGKLILNVQITRPIIGMKIVPDVTTTTKPPVEKAAPSTGNPLDAYKDKIVFGVNLSIKDGSINVLREKDNYKIERLGLDFTALDLNKPWNLSTTFSAGIKSGTLDLQLPIKITSEFKFDGDLVETQKSQIDVSGVALELKGSARLSTEKHDWTVGLQIQELKSLPIPPAFLPDGVWSGGVTATVRALHEKGKDWQAAGKIKILHLKGDQLSLVKPGMTAKGSVIAEADVDFNYEKSLTLNKILAQVDMTNLLLDMKDKFSKPAGVRLALDVDGDQAQSVLNLKKALIEFAAIKANVSGRFSSDGRTLSTLSINIPRASLTGLEKFFPPLSTMPLQGFVEVKAQVDGNFQKPETLTVNINPLLLQNVRGQLQWVDLEAKSDKKSVQGPVSLNAKVIVVAQGQNLKSASITLQTDLTGLSVAWGEMLQKKAQWPLKLNIAAKQKGKLIELSSSELSSSFGKILLKGTIKEIQAPVMSLKLQVPKLDLTMLSQWVPMLATYKLSGQASSNLQISGKYDFAKGVEGSPLTVAGNASVTIPQFNYKSKPIDKAADGKKEEGGGADNTEATAKPATAILPPWPLYKNLNLKMSARINGLDYNDLTMKNIKFDGAIGSAGSGMLTGNLSAQNVFDGSVIVDKIKTSLLQVAPTTEMNIKVSQLDIAKALQWGAPTWKSMAKGIATGNISLKLPHPSRQDFITAAESSGDLKIAKGWLSTLPFDQFVNEKMSSIPGVTKNNNFKTGGATADLQAIYQLSRGQLNLSTLNVLTPERNELKSSGWVKLVEKTLDLKGTAFVATVDISGPFLEANSDSTGRLMVPVHFTGSVFKPDLNLTDATIKEMLGRTAKNEGEKFKKQATQKAKDEVQKQVDQQKSRLEEEAKKLFKF